MPGTYQLHLLVLMFYFDFSCEYTFKCICVGLCENIMYGKLCSCGPQQRQTQLLPSLTTNSTLPGPRSSHSTDPVPCECGKECREERQERALPEWTMNPFTNSFPLIHATPLRIGYHYPHIIAEESQGGPGSHLFASSMCLANVTKNRQRSLCVHTQNKDSGNVEYGP